MTTANPTFVQRTLNRYAKVEYSETAVALAAFFLLFFVMGSYFAVRPVRETIGTILGRDYVANLWISTAIFSIAIVPIYGWLVARIHRRILLPCIYGGVSLVLVILGTYFRADQSDRLVGAIFYVWISVFNLMLVSVFWSFMLEILSSEQTKRLFGFIAAGGTLGALVGPLITRLTAEALGTSGIMYLGAAGFVGAILCQRLLISIWSSGSSGALGASDTPSAGDAGGRGAKGVGGNPFAGIAIVLKSPYLIGIATFVMLLSAANTVLYFEQLRIVSDTFTDTARRTEVFANIDFAVQSLTIVSQLFLTGRIAARLGVKSLLTIIPIAMIFGFILLSAFNVFGMMAAALILRRWGEYAFIRPGREMLFSKLDTETKYKAKNFIDVPVYRAADSLGAQAKIAIDALGTSPAQAALIGAVVAAVWAVNGWFLGRKHDGPAKS